MTQVHADHNHILCLFEDIQYHLSELGFPSYITEGKIIVTYENKDYELVDDTVSENSIRFYTGDLDPYLKYLGDYRKLTDGMITIQRAAFRLLYDLLPQYLEITQELERDVEDDKR